MSLNQIQLTSQLLTDFYTNVLIELKSASVAQEYEDQKKGQAIRYLGNNAKNIVLLVNNSSAPFLSDSELSFLTTILAACQLSLADVALVNVYTLKEDQIETAIQPLAPLNILLFGITPLSIGLPINFPHFQLQPFNKRTYLYSPALRELEADKGLKLKLWHSLKTLFGL